MLSTMDEQLAHTNNEESKSTLTMISKPGDDNKHLTDEEAEFESVSSQLQSSLNELRQFREELVVFERKVVEARAKFIKEISTFRNIFLSINDNITEQSNESAACQNKKDTDDTAQSTSAAPKETSGHKTSENIDEVRPNMTKDDKPQNKVASNGETIQNIPLKSIQEKMKNVDERVPRVAEESTGKAPSQDGSPKSKFASQKETLTDMCKAGVSDKTPGNKASGITELHLSSVKIKKWEGAGKPNDAVTMEKVKQVCGALNGDDIYHYENIEDFDDTNKRFNPIAMKNKSKVINCKFVLNEDGGFSPASFCKGKEKKGKRFDQKRYMSEQIASGKTTVSCGNKGCSNVYDPWDVARFLGTKDGYLWYEMVALDPVKSNHIGDATKQNSISEKVSAVTNAAKEETPDKKPKKRWWQKKNKVAKQKDDLSEPQLNQTSKEMKLFTIDALLDTEAERSHKYECETCFEGFDDDPQKGYNTCGHYNCKSCLKIYFNNQIQNMITNIECPRPDCKEEFDCSFIIRLLSHENKPAYIRLRRIRRELEFFRHTKGRRSKSACQGGPDCTQNKCVCKLPGNLESWVEKSRRYAYCPECGTIIEKKNDGRCNMMLCLVCRTEFCWICKKICDEGSFHIFECPLWGSKKFSKRRVILNYLSFGTAVAIVVPLGFSFAVGWGAVVVTAGTLSPPYFLAKELYKFHKRQNSSTLQRNLSVIAAASLGVIAMPFLSLWGIFKTFKIAKKTTVDAFDRWMDEYEEDEDEEYLDPPFNAKNKQENDKVPLKSSHRDQKQRQVIETTQNHNVSKTPESVHEQEAVKNKSTSNNTAAN